MVYVYSSEIELHPIPLSVVSVFLIAFLVIFGFVLWTLVDLLRSEFTGFNKIVWLLTIIMLPPLGSVLYMIIGRGQKVQPRKSIGGFKRETTEDEQTEK